MIRSFSNEYKKYKIIPPTYSTLPSSNTLTVIVGKNGTGKSRLLRSIILHLLSQYSEPINLEREDKLTGSYKILGKSDYTKLPNKIICTSTSPFDKFPLIKDLHESNPYTYLGLKGLPSNNLSMSYMAKIIAELIKSINRSNNTHEIIRILNYLGYKGKLSCIFSTSTANTTRRKYFEEINPKNFKLRFPNEDIEKYNLLINSITYKIKNEVIFPTSTTKEHKNIVLNYLKKSSDSQYKPRIELIIDKGGLYFNGDASPDEALALISTGYAKLRSLKLEKEGAGIINITDASSGEQSVVMSLLGISSQITDNSLVCIDEPEICLHPEWQERYIHLLLEIFEKYKECQFIIATHSPQIIAELSQKNCFVMKMEDGEAICSEEYSNKSIDFQLVNVFNTPGRRNEYLNRIALNLFTRVAKNKKFTSEDEKEMAILNGIFEKIKSEDPLKELISALQLIWEKYGRN